MEDNKDLLVLPSTGGLSKIVDEMNDKFSVTKGSYKNLEFKIKDNKVSILHDGVDMQDFSNIWLASYWNTRDLAYAIRLYLKQKKGLLVHAEKSTSKLTDQVKFVMAGINCPDSFYVKNCNVLNYIEQIEETCGYPLIAKNTKGFGGEGSLLINSRVELIEKSKLIPEGCEFIFQKFIPNDYDWGVIVADGKVVSGEKSYPKDGEFRNNAKNGSTEVFVEIDEIPENVQEMAIKASEVLGLKWSRADIVIDRNTNIAYLMEVNRYPGITKNSTEETAARDYFMSLVG